jgi:hypothetical protein
MISGLNSGLKDLGDEMQGLSQRAEKVANDVEMIRYDRMDAKSKAAFLRNGGLAHVDNRDDLLRLLDTQAKFDAAHESLAITAVGLSALHKFTSVVLKDEALSKTVNDAANTVQAAQYALTIFAAFTPAGSAIAAFQAFGGLSGMAGQSQGSGPSVEMQEINAQLKGVIDLQIKTLQSLERVHAKLDRLQGSIDRLSEETKLGFAKAMESQYNGVYVDCFALLRAASFRSNADKNMIAKIPLPFENAEYFTRYHFVTAARWQDLISQQGANCNGSLRALFQKPTHMQQIGQVDEHGARSDALAKEEARLRDIHAYMRAHQERRLPPTQNKADMQLGMALALTTPSTSLYEMRQQYVARMRKPVADAARPCWWRTSGSTECSWSGAQVGDEHLDYLTGDTLIHAWQLVKVFDLGLSFYPQHLLPNNVPLMAGSGETIDPTALAAAIDDKLRKKAGDDVRYMLTDAVRIADASVAHEAMLEGDIIAEMIARDLLEPPIITAGTALATKVDVDGTTAVPPDRLPPACIEKWAGSPAGVTAPANALLLDNPHIAKRALQLVVHHSLMPVLSHPGISKRVVSYEAARADDPLGHAERSFYTEAYGLGPVTPAVSDGQSPQVREWWNGVFRLEESLDKLSINGAEKLVRHAGRGFEMYYAYTDGLKTSIAVARRADNNSKDVCGGYQLTQEEVTLPRGWSISAGGLIMALPDAAEIMRGPIEKGARLKAVAERRDLLKTELASMVVPIEASLKPLLKYQMARRAHASLAKHR